MVPGYEPKFWRSEITSVHAPGTILYTRDAGGTTAAFTTSFGAGSLTYFGWDLFAVGTLAQRTDWFSAIASTHVPARVPEPGTLAIMGLGLAGLGFARRKKAA